MNTVRFCFAATVAFLVVAIGWWATDAKLCCEINSDKNVTYCENKHRKFHEIKSYGNGSCEKNETAHLVQKCCPPWKLYNPEMQICQYNDDWYSQTERFMDKMLQDKFLTLTEEMWLVGYIYKTPTCNVSQVLVDLYHKEILSLKNEVNLGLPLDYCLDLTTSDELVARTCRPLEQHCSLQNNNYTCVKKCCNNYEALFIDDDYSIECETIVQSPFSISVYETNTDGSPPEVLSNNTLLPYYNKLSCTVQYYEFEGYKMVENGSLYSFDKKQYIWDREYCIEYIIDKSGFSDLYALICVNDTKSTTDNTTTLLTGGNWNLSTLFVEIINVVSAVCLGLSLLVYNTLPSLRNIRNYYVKWYIGNLFVSYICQIFLGYMKNLQYQWCVLFGYFNLFSYLTTCGWLNIICFDIYWKIRYNSINRNTSTSVRTIMYHIYSVGFSSICVCTGFLFQYSEQKRLRKLAPDFGDPFCWFNKIPGYGITIFLLIPVSFMLIANFILFLLTSFYCSRIKSKLNEFKRTDSKTEGFFVYKEKFVMSTKLFLIMGGPYFFSILPLIFHWHWLICFTIDVISGLQGVFVFMIFVAKRKVRLELWKKFRGSTNHNDSTQNNTISNISMSS